jgi:hypothetical protein
MAVKRGTQLFRFFKELVVRTDHFVALT